MLKKGIWWLWLIMFCGSCRDNGKQKSAAELLKKQNTINNVSVEARFVKENNDAVNAYEPADDSFLYFNVRLIKPDLDPDLKTKEYLNFKMQEDFKMLNEGDTLLPVIVHRIINGIKGSYEYLVGFERGYDFGQSGNVSILYQDKIFGIGTQVFEFKKEDILK